MSLETLIPRLETELCNIQGDVYTGNITGHGYEWRAVHKINVDSEEEHEAEFDDLVFSIFENSEGEVSASLWIEHYSDQCGGVSDKTAFPGLSANTKLIEIQKWISHICTEWGFPESKEGGYKFAAQCLVAVQAM